MEELNAAMDAGTNSMTKIWMNWMMLLFLASIIFIWRHKPARYVLASLIATAVLAVIIWYLTKNIYLLGVGHIVFWVPLGLYLYQKVYLPNGFAQMLKSIYGVWILLIMATIAISLVFDVREVIKVIFGLH